MQKPYEFIRFLDPSGQKPDEFIGIPDLAVKNSYEFPGLGNRNFGGLKALEIAISKAVKPWKYQFPRP